MGTLVNNYHSLPQLLKGDPVRGNKRTAVKIKQEHQDAIKDAVAIFKAVLEGNGEDLEQGRERARTILSSSKSVAELLNKSRTHSAIARQQATEVTADAITGILGTGERLDVSEIKGALEQAGIRVSIPRLRSILGLLSSSNVLKVHSDRSRSDTLQKRKYYSLSA